MDIAKNMSRRKVILNNLFETIKQLNDNHTRFENKYYDTFNRIKSLPQHRRKLENYKQMQNFFKKMNTHENMFKLKIDEMQKLTANIKLNQNFVPFTGKSNKVTELRQVKNYQNRGVSLSKPKRSRFVPFEGTSQYLSNAPKTNLYKLTSLQPFRRGTRQRKPPERLEF